MTYRVGSYVVDVGKGQVVQVVGATDGLVRVSDVGGGPQRGVPAEMLRLATREERQAAGLRPYQVGCDTCAELEMARQAAAAGEDRDRSRNATAAAYAHWIASHSVPTSRRGN
ncbi:hypothetical protein GCM10020221_17150 [Streptomyces thioluteus]|uniref:Uncharacterized protein n=1 Tax=Streptomyces thioluteus TaxID=66431 RepID=A0ABP6J5G2_STRTU